MLFRSEVRRILLELSALVGAQATAIGTLVQLLAELDLAPGAASNAGAASAANAKATTELQPIPRLAHTGEWFIILLRKP